MRGPPRSVDLSSQDPCHKHIGECIEVLANEETLLRWREASGPLRSGAIDATVGAYFDALGKCESPGPPDIQAAVRAAETILAKTVLTQEWVAAVSGASLQDSDRKAALELSFNAVRPALKIPSPQIVSELSPVRMGIAALVGAIGGMLIFTPLTRVLLDMRDVGLFVGAPVGAFLLVLAAWHSARSMWLRRFLVAAFGVAAIGEVWGILSGGGILRRLWAQLGGRRSALKRILLYVSVIFVLVIAKPRPKFDRQQHQPIVRSAIDQWLDAALPALGLLLEPTKEKTSANADAEATLSDVVQQVGEMRSFPAENLPAAVEELRQFLKYKGFEFEEQSQKMFLWQTERRDEYEVFGHVEPGNRVIIEREPVVFQGAVRKKGLVRKVRERS